MLNLILTGVVAMLELELVPCLEGVLPTSPAYKTRSAALLEEMVVAGVDG